MNRYLFRCFTTGNNLKIVQELDRKQIAGIEARMGKAERKYLHFLASAVTDLNNRELEFMWNKVKEKSQIHFEPELPAEEAQTK